MTTTMKADETTPNTGDWKTRHEQALSMPRYFERPIVNALKAWDEYAKCHKARYESRIGDDGVMGSHWFDWAKSIKGLLNGDTGRLDCGTLEHFIRTTLVANGFSEDEVDRNL